MSNYIVSDTSLSSVADAIREKTGSSEQLVFPNGFVSEIENIAGGITVTETEDTHGGTIKNIVAVDLSEDTVDAEHLASGYTAHDKDGNAVTGIMNSTNGITGLTYYGTTTVFRQGTYAQPAFPVITNTSMILVCPDTISGGFVLFTAGFNDDATKYDYGAISKGRSITAYRNYSVTEGATVMTPSRYTAFSAWAEDYTINDVPVYLINIQ